MSTDPALITQQPTPSQTTVVAQATAPTPAEAAQGVQDVVSAGGIIGTLQEDLQGNPMATFIGVGVILLVLLAVFVYLVVAAVNGTGNTSTTAQHYLAQIFGGSTTVWVIVGIVLVGGALMARSPLQNPPSIPGISAKK